MGIATITPARPPQLFATTHWSLILKAGASCEESLAFLCENYRRPLLAYLRCLGKTHEEAEDLVQGFLAKFVGRSFLDGLSPDKGRFRTYLIKSLKHHLCDQHDKATAAKRGGGAAHESLDDSDGQKSRGLQIADSLAGPDRAFDRAWAETVLGQALARLQQECVAAGRADLFTALEPVMHQDATAPGYREIAAQLQMTEGALRVAAKRLRDRLRHLIREEVLQTVAKPEDGEAELRYLVELFSR